MNDFSCGRKGKAVVGSKRKWKWRWRGMGRGARGQGVEVTHLVWLECPTLCVQGASPCVTSWCNYCHKRGTMQFDENYRNKLSFIIGNYRLSSRLGSAVTETINFCVGLLLRQPQEKR